MAIFSSDSHRKVRARASQQPSPLVTERVSSAGWLQMLVPGTAVLMTFGLFGYAIFAGTAGDQVPGKLAMSNAQKRPAASFQPLWVLQLQETNQTRRVHPSAEITGDVAVEAGWIKNFTAKLGSFGNLDSQAWFSGGGRTGARTVLAMYGPITAPMPETQYPQFVTAALLGGSPRDIQLALATPAKLQRGEAGPATSSMAALQSLRIEFPANSATIPSQSIPLVKRVAGMIKQLPGGTIVELSGYTARTSTSIGDKDLSQRRADSVYKALVDAGVSPGMLSPRGYGARSMQASASSATEGRSSTAPGNRAANDRRVEFRVISQPR